MKVINVVIVEDLHEIRDGLKAILNSTEEFKCVATFCNAEDAAKEIALLQPDVVLMDINLPGMTGIDCVKMIKSNCPQTQFLIFTVYDDDQRIFDAISAGASGYLLKKTPPVKILEAIKEIFEGGAPMSAQIARRVVQVFQNGEKSSKEADLLSPREREILELLSKGFLYKEIASKLFIAVGTVKQHVHKIYEKLHVQNKTEAINKVFLGRG